MLIAVFLLSNLSPSFFTQSFQHGRRIIRSILVLFHIFTGVLLSLLLIQPALFIYKQRALNFQQRIVRWWFRRFTHILHLHIKTIGKPTPETAIFVANHISWVDILVLGQLAPVNFISKVEVKSWPVGGWLADVAGTLFIQRGNRNSAEHIQTQMQTRLEQQRSICFFPEGTSTEGDTVKHFRRRLFQAALNIHLPVQPMALCYPKDNKPNRIIAYVGEDTLLSNLYRLLGQKDTAVEVQFCPVIDSRQYTEAIALAEAAWQQVRSKVEQRYQ